MIPVKPTRSKHTKKIQNIPQHSIQSSKLDRQSLDGPSEFDSSRSSPSENKNKNKSTDSQFSSSNGNFDKRNGNLDSIYKYFQDNPDAPEFFYFVCTKGKANSTGSMYNLKFIPTFGQLRKGGHRNNYYTMSAAGMTQFTQNNIKFTPIDEWFRERELWNLTLPTPADSSKHVVDQQKGPQSKPPTRDNDQTSIYDIKDPESVTTASQTSGNILNIKTTYSGILSKSIDCPQPISSEQRKQIPLNERFIRGMYFRMMLLILKRKKFERMKKQLIYQSQGLWLQSLYGEFGVYTNSKISSDTENTKYSTEVISETSSSGSGHGSGRANIPQNVSTRARHVIHNPSSVLFQPLKFIVCSPTSGKLHLIPKMKRLILVDSLPLFSPSSKHLRDIVYTLAANSQTWENKVPFHFKQLVISKFNQITSIQNNSTDLSPDITPIQPIDINSTELYLQDNGQDPNITNLSITEVHSQLFSHIKTILSLVQKDISLLISDIIRAFQTTFQILQLVDEPSSTTSDSQTNDQNNSNSLQGLKTDVNMDTTNKIKGTGSNLTIKIKKQNVKKSSSPAGGYDKMIRKIIQNDSSDRCIGKINTPTGWIEFPSELKITQQTLLRRESTRLLKFLYFVDIFLSESLSTLTNTFISEWKKCFQEDERVPVYTAMSQSEYDTIDSNSIPDSLYETHSTITAISPSFFSGLSNTNPSTSWALKQISINISTYLVDNQMRIYPSPAQVSKTFISIWRRISTTLLSIPTISSNPKFDILRSFKEPSYSFVPRFKQITVEYPRTSEYLAWESKHEMSKSSASNNPSAFRHMLASSSVANYTNTQNTLKPELSATDNIPPLSQKYKDPLLPIWSEVLLFTGGALKTDQRFQRIDKNGVLKSEQLPFLDYSNHSRSLLFLTTPKYCVFSCELRNWVAWSFSLLSEFTESSLKTVVRLHQWHSNLNVDWKSSWKSKLTECLKSQNGSDIEFNSSRFTEDADDNLPNDIFEAAASLISNAKSTHPKEQIIHLFSRQLSLSPDTGSASDSMSTDDPSSAIQSQTSDDPNSSTLIDPKTWGSEKKTHIGAMLETLKLNLNCPKQHLLNDDDDMEPDDDSTVPTGKTGHDTLSFDYSQLLSVLHYHLAVLLIHWRLYSYVSSTRFPVQDPNLLAQSFDRFKKSYKPNPRAATLPPINMTSSAIFQVDLSPLLSKCLSDLLESIFSLRTVLLPVIREHQNGIMNLLESKLHAIEAPLGKASDYVQRSLLLSQISTSLQDSWYDEVNSLDSLFGSISQQQAIQPGVVFAHSLSKLWYKISKETFQTDMKHKLIPQTATFGNYLCFFPPECPDLTIDSLDSAQHHTILNLVKSIEELVSCTNTKLHSNSQLLQFRKLIVEERKTLVSQISGLIKLFTQTISPTPRIQKNSILTVELGFINNEKVGSTSDSDEKVLYCEFEAPESNILDIVAKLETISVSSDSIVKHVATWEGARQVLSTWIKDYVSDTKTKLESLQKLHPAESTESTESTDITESDEQSAESSNSIPEQIQFLEEQLQSLNVDTIPPEFEDPDSSSSVLVSLIGKFSSHIGYFHSLWELCQSFLLSFVDWMGTKLLHLDADKLVSSLQSMIQSANSLGKKLASSHIPENEQLVSPGSHIEASQFTEFPTKPPPQTISFTCDISGKTQQSFIKIIYHSSFTEPYSGKSALDRYCANSAICRK